jgi:hypothetical protein
VAGGRLVMLAALYEDLLDLLLETLQIEGVDEVEDVADLVRNLPIVETT